MSRTHWYLWLSVTQNRGRALKDHTFKQLNRPLLCCRREFPPPDADAQAK